MTKLWLMRAFMPLAGRFPRLFYGVAHAVALTVLLVRPSTRRQLESNLAPFCDSKTAVREAAGKAARNIARYYVDLATMPRRDIARYEHDHIVAIEGEEHLELLTGGRPVIIASAHLGNPELVIGALGTRGRPFVALVEPLRPAGVGEYLGKLRAHAGGEFVEADLGGIRLAFETLRAGGVVALLADRDIQKTGVCVTFGGRRAKLPSGTWDLARRTGAVILPAFARRVALEDQMIHVEAPFCVETGGEEAKDIQAAAQHWAILLEAQIRRDPGQWTVLEDFWRVHGCG